MKLVTWNGDWRDNAMPLTIDVTSKQYKHCFWFLLGRVDDEFDQGYFWKQVFSYSKLANVHLICYLQFCADCLLA